MDAINLGAELSAFPEHWSPKVFAGFNGHDVMVVKAQGTFVCHFEPAGTPDTKGAATAAGRVAV